MRVALLLASFVAMSAWAQQDAEPATADTPAAKIPSVDSSVGDAPAAGSGGGVKTLSGMSILGNEEAPKSLVIVPWKSSRIGDGIGVANALDDTPRAVDREVFMREVRYYELRSAGSN